MSSEWFMATIGQAKRAKTIVPFQTLVHMEMQELNYTERSQPTVTSFLKVLCAPLPGRTSLLISLFTLAFTAPWERIN